VPEPSPVEDLPPALTRPALTRPALTRPALTRPALTRVALVTGAGQGIGRAVAVRFARAGYRVVLLGRRSAPLAAVQAEIATVGGESLAGVADVRDYDQVRQAAEAVEARWGRIDVLVNNAGVIDPIEVPVWGADPDQWWQVVETDLRGPFHCIRAVVPGMLERGGGRVLSLNSGAGATDREIYSAYCAAKAGLFRLTGNLHLAGFDRGLRAFEISPGTVRTAMTTAMPMHRDRTEWTSMQDVVELLLAAADGSLDAWSGCFLRAGIDTTASLVQAAEQLGAGKRGAGKRGAEQPPRVPDTARRLAVARWGEADPLT
jgi:3-oxoacyl-[acyl-carrier protein] reductase